MHSSRSAFTLIELLVGITIIVILSTAAFVGYSTYTTKTRDATRLHDITTIYSSLSLQIQKSGTMPIPENGVTFVNSGSTLPVGYQGSVGPSILKSLGIDKWGRDPKEFQYYSYIRDKNGTKGQILGLFEEIGKWVGLDPLALTIPEVSAANLSQRYPVTTGDRLGVVYHPTTKIPLEQTATGNVVIQWLSASGYHLRSPCESNGSGSSVVADFSKGEYTDICDMTYYCSFITNTMGVDGDESVCIDNRVYTHDPIIVAANGGDPNFFDRRYKLLKMNGKWWMNQNLAYPMNWFYYVNQGITAHAVFYSFVSGYPAYANSLYCPVNETWASQCNETGSRGYVYFNGGASGGFSCPIGWGIPNSITTWGWSLDLSIYKDKINPISGGGGTWGNSSPIIVPNEINIITSTVGGGWALYTWTAGIFDMNSGIFNHRSSHHTYNLGGIRCIKN